MNAANRKAWLDTIAFSELGPLLKIPETDNGYRVIVGSRPGALILMDGYASHPNRLVDLPKLGVKSTAAGRYQLLYRYYGPYARLLKLKDFSPAAQDAIALQQTKEQRALEDVDAGRFEEAVHKCSNIWASLPGAGYGQHENKFEALQVAFVSAGGVLA